jgi:hypothetical protein
MGMSISAARGYTYRSINSAEHVHLEIHKIAILDDPAHLG